MILNDMPGYIYMKVKTKFSILTLSNSTLANLQLLLANNFEDIYFSGRTQFSPSTISR